MEVAALVAAVPDALDVPPEVAEVPLVPEPAVVQPSLLDDASRPTPAARRRSAPGGSAAAADEAREVVREPTVVLVVVGWVGVVMAPCSLPTLPQPLAVAGRTLGNGRRLR